MALLDGVRARVTAGHGQVVALVGEPGVGKSRITYELARAARERGGMTLEGHAASYGAATPYLPLGDLLRRYFRLDDDDAPGVVRDRIPNVASQPLGQTGDIGRFLAACATSNRAMGPTRRAKC